MRRADPVTLVAGIVVLVLGGLLLADAGGAPVPFEYALPAALAAAGAVLVALGLSRGR